MDGVPLTEAIGRRLRQIRDAAGITAEEVAEMAREYGLRWQRVTVASLETGRRAVTADELLLLPAVLTDATGTTVRLRDFFVEPVLLGDVAVTPAGIRAVLESKRAGSHPNDDDWDWPDLLQRTIKARESLDDRRGEVPAGLDEYHLERGAYWAVDEATQTLARRHGVTPFQAAVASSVAWGERFREVRDRRVGTAGKTADPETLRALRGHVARELDKELRATLSELGIG